MLLGALYSILSSAAFGINTVFTRRGVLGASATNGLYISVPLGVPLLAIAALVTGQLIGLGAISLTGYLLLTAAGIFHFILGRYSNYRATGAIGANRSNPLRAMATPFSIVTALLFLGERISWFNGLGIVTVVLAPAIMIEGAERRRRAPSTPPVTGGSNGAQSAATQGPPTATSDPPRPREFVPTRAQLVEGYTFGALSAVGYGISPLLIRAAIGGTGLGIAGALISYAAATLVLMAGLVQPGRLSRLRHMDRKALGWFLLTGVSVFFAQMFRYVALDLAPVTVVTPLQQSSAIFGLFFAFLFNRQMESFTPRVLIGIALSVLGSLAVVWPS